MSSSPFYACLKKQATLGILNCLLRFNGFPLLPTCKQLLCVKYMYCVVRKFSVCFVNIYFMYRILKLFQHKDITFDLFPVINAGVTACSVNSIALQYKQFTDFSSRMNNLLQKHKVFLSGGSFLKLSIFYAVSTSYFMICGVVFPADAAHVFDSAINTTVDGDFLHLPEVETFTHTVIFITCSSSIVGSLMLYCFICALLQEVLHSIYVDIRDLQSQGEIEPRCIHEFRVRFLEVANMVHVTDKVFSLFGLVGLCCVFSRACACIHFYLNLGKTPPTTWWFVITQITFDVSALTAVCCFAASVSETARRISPMVLLVNNRIPPKNISFHLLCYNFAKIILTQEVQLTAWKLFPFSRRVLPTVIGVTLSYITVIIQMHHATSIKSNYYYRF